MIWWDRHLTRALDELKFTSRASSSSGPSSDQFRQMQNQIANLQKQRLAAVHQDSPKGGKGDWGQTVRCWNCGSTEHHTKNCPIGKGKGKDKGDKGAKGGAQPLALTDSVPRRGPKKQKKKPSHKGE